MAIDTRLPAHFFLPVSDGISLSLPKSVTNEKEEAGLKLLLDKAKMLATDQHAIFTARVYLIAGEIKAYIQELRRRGYSENEVERMSEALNARLHALGGHFLDKTFENYQKKMHASCSAMNFDRRLQEIKIDYPDFTASPMLKAPSVMGLISTARKLQVKVKEQLPPSYAHSKANVEQNMAIARVVGWTVDKIAEGMKEGCESTTQSKRLCQYGQDLAKDLMEVTGLSRLAVEPKALPQVLHDLYGIDKEAGVQYSNDGLKTGVLLATSAIPAGVGAVFRSVRPFGSVALKTIGQQEGMTWTMRFLKEDAGSVVIPFFQGIKPSALRASEQSFRQLSFTMHRIACEKFANRPTEPLFAIWYEYNHLLKSHIPDLSHQVNRLASPKNAAPFEVMMKEATGMDPVFMTLVNSSPSKSMFKISNSRQSLYIGEMSEEESLANFYSLHHARELGLKHAEFPVPVALRRYGHANYVVMSDVGESFPSVFQKASEPFTRQQVYELGRAEGELHAKKAMLAQPGTPLHHDFVGMCKSRVLQVCQGKNISNQQVLRIHDLVGETLQHTPVYAGLTHGDAHIGNFTWSWETGKVGIIDLGRYQNHLNVQMEATGFPVIDYVLTIRSIVLHGKQMKMPESQIISYSSAFKEGYHTMHPSEPVHVLETINSIYELE